MGLAACLAVVVCGFGYNLSMNKDLPKLDNMYLTDEGGQPQETPKLTFNKAEELLQQNI